MITELEKYINSGNIDSFSPPGGGMAIWVNVGALERGAYLQDKATFQLGSDANLNCYIRLVFAGMCEQQIKIGL